MIVFFKTSVPYDYLDCNISSYTESILCVCDLVLFRFQEILQEKALEVMSCLSPILVFAELGKERKDEKLSRNLN